MLRWQGHFIIGLEILLSIETTQNEVAEIGKVVLQDFQFHIRYLQFRKMSDRKLLSPDPEGAEAAA